MLACVYAECKKKGAAFVGERENEVLWVGFISLGLRGWGLCVWAWLWRLHVHLCLTVWIIPHKGIREKITHSLFGGALS